MRRAERLNFLCTLTPARCSPRRRPPLPAPALRVTRPPAVAQRALRPGRNLPARPDGPAARQDALAGPSATTPRGKPTLTASAAPRPMAPAGPRLFPARQTRGPGHCPDFAARAIQRDQAEDERARPLAGELTRHAATTCANPQQGRDRERENRGGAVAVYWRARRPTFVAPRGVIPSPGAGGPALTMPWRPSSWPDAGPSRPGGASRTAARSSEGARAAVPYPR